MGRRRKNHLQSDHRQCRICFTSYQASHYDTPRCSSRLTVSNHHICNDCLFRYITAAVQSGARDKIQCMVLACDGMLSNDLIETILLQFKATKLLNEYKSHGEWCDTSEEWIRKFTAKCTNCRVPIEKIQNSTNIHFQYIVLFSLQQNTMNSFGVNSYAGIYPQQYPGVYSPQGYNNQYGVPGGCYTGGLAYPNASPYAAGYPSLPYGGQVAQGYGYPVAPSNYGYQQPYYAPQYSAAPQAPFGYPFPTVQQPQQPYPLQQPQQQPYPSQQPPYNNVNYPPNAYYDPSRSRQSSRQRSRARRQLSSSSSSSSDEEHQRNSPYTGPSSSGDNF